MGGINSILVQTLVANFDFTTFQPSHAIFSWSQFLTKVYGFKVALKYVIVKLCNYIFTLMTYCIVQNMVREIIDEFNDCL